MSSDPEKQLSMRERVIRDNRPLGECPGEVGSIVCTFKDAMGETQSKNQIEFCLTTMVQSRIISPDVAQAVMAGFSQYPKTITMEMLEVAWFSQVGKKIAYLKAKSRRIAAEEELAKAIECENKAKSASRDEQNTIYNL